MLKNKKSKNKKWREDLWVIFGLVSIVFLGLVLRLIGIKHGFPFIFHPDEPTIIRSALGIRFDPNPGHFDWPHLYIYLNYFLYMIFARLRTLVETAGLKDKFEILMPLIWNDNLIYYYLTRCFSAILGALTAIPVYLAGKNLFGRKAGILAALAIAIMPYHMWHSHYALGDIPTAFLLSWALYFAARILKEDDLKNYVLSGLFIGFAASIKYNGGLSALMVPTAHFLKIFWQKKKLRNEKKARREVNLLNREGILSLFLSGLSAFLGFLVGTPYALLDFKTFSSREYGKGAFWQFENVGSVNFSEHVAKFFTESFGRLLADTGYVVIPVFFIGLLYLIYKIVKNKIEEKDIFLTFLYVVSLFLLWYMSGFENTRSHYYFVIYPYLAIIFGFNVVSFLKVLGGYLQDNVVNLKTKKFLNLLMYLYLGIFLSPLFFKSFINSYMYYRGDTKNVLYQWLVSNYNYGETLIYNDNALKDIFVHMGIKSNKGLEKFDDFSESLIVVNDPNFDERAFLEENSALIEKLVKFDSKLRLGDDIEVYKYTAPEKSSGGCGCGR